MFAGLKRHIDTCHTPELMCPHTAAIDDKVCLNGTGFFTAVALPADTGNLSVRLLNSCDFHAFKYLCTVLFRSFGQRQCNVGRVPLTIFFKIDAPVTSSTFKCG